MPLQCNKHKEKSKYPVRTGDDLKTLLTNPYQFCKLKCGDMFECGLHECTQCCLPQHFHASCMVIVEFFFPKEICQYQHKNYKKCYESIRLLKCKDTVEFTFTDCGHKGTKMCHEDKAKKKCKTMVAYKPPNCKHVKQVECHMKQVYLIQPPACEESVSFR